ncbi:SUMF1/EgtB/PvdO family nonheme iron enzyme [Magnetofaba australis]|uniref:Sulfatase-modifying factor enzyme-like domain-containing protein n=1 Tax=Magnetofaba australis IT-1 TaxID=1434232 RepID=A0A1Y2K1N2_9PROT|nr:SUMF1/EgtB/PvdO family nonheme iron enzyme [Magnetofaba australis]OSM01536.1 hypothetical protein MAIT1_01531 [Magnetofaba australis IT-1]
MVSLKRLFTLVAAAVMPAALIAPMAHANGLAPVNGLAPAGMQQQTSMLAPLGPMVPVEAHIPATFSPGGRLLAEAEPDGSVAVRDLTNNGLLSRLRGHQGGVTSISFSPDGRRVVTGGNDRTARLWDAATGKLEATLGGHGGVVQAVSFSMDGRFVLTGGADSTVRLWDAKSGRILRIQPRETRLISFAPDRRYAVSVDTADPRLIHHWESVSGEEVGVFEGHTWHITRLIFSPDGKRMASADGAGAIILWDTTTREPVSVLQGHNGPVASLAFSRDSKRLLSADRDHAITLWDAETGQPWYSLQAPPEGVAVVAFDAQETAMPLTLSPDGALRSWDPQTAESKLLRAGRSVTLEVSSPTETIAPAPAPEVLLPVVPTAPMEPVPPAPAANIEGALTPPDAYDGPIPAAQAAPGSAPPSKSVTPPTMGHNRSAPLKPQAAAAPVSGAFSFPRATHVAPPVQQARAQRVTPSRVQPAPMRKAVAQSKPAAPSPRAAMAALFQEPRSGVTFAWAPGGCYKMGANGAEITRAETPAHRVCVDGFWMGRFEVTQEQWTRLMKKNPSQFRNGPNYPVEQVSWSDVQEFVRRLNAASTDGARYRLPTEAEWEFACRAGGPADRPCGGSSNVVAWHNGNAPLGTQPVGGKAPNALGLYDMSGNVLEWTADGYRENFHKIASRRDGLRNPHGDADSPNRAVRGGSWRSQGDESLRASRRHGLPPQLKHASLGFRLVRVGPPPAAMTAQAR